MIYTRIFPCGMRFAFRRTKSPVAYSALTIKSGTRNEPEALYGIAHMTEHMLFKGTQKRTPSEINNRLESLGGELNAFTSKEETVVYSTVLREDTSKAVELMLEIAFTSTFSDRELQKERLVVIDEINMYKDSPSESIYDDFERLLFEGHPLSRNILGSASSLKKVSSDNLRSYVKDNFTPENMCISLVADLTPQKAEKIVERAVSHFISSAYVAPCGAAASRNSDSLSIGKVFNKEVIKKNHQANCIIGTSAYSLYQDERLPVILLSNILGGPSSNSRLNQLLRERNALVYNIDCSYVQFSDTGSLLMGFGCEKANLDRCVELVHKELAHLRDVPFSESALKAAKKQLLGQLAISSDNGEAQALAMGKSMIAYNDVLSDDETRRLITGVTSEDIQKTACTLFSTDRLSTLIYR